MSRSKKSRPAPELPEDLEQYERDGAELLARITRLRETIERKRRQGWDFNPRLPVAAPETAHDENVRSQRPGPR